jgi:hypothetical protein
LLLKFIKSVGCNWPVFIPLAKGRLILSELVLVEILKIFPAVPVETFVITLLPKVICVEVPMSTFCPPAMESPEPTVKFPNVDVPMPPLLTGITPVIAIVDVPLMAMLLEPVSNEAISE